MGFCEWPSSERENEEFLLVRSLSICNQLHLPRYLLELEGVSRLVSLFGDDDKSKFDDILRPPDWTRLHLLSRSGPL